MPQMIDASTWSPLPPWAISFVGLRESGVEIRDVEGSYKPLVDDAGIRAVAKHYGDHRDPVRYYDVVYRESSWKCRTRSVPSICSTIVIWLNEHLTEPAQPPESPAATPPRQLTWDDLEQYLRECLQIALIATAHKWDPPNPIALAGLLEGYVKGIVRLADEDYPPGETFVSVLERREYGRLARHYPGNWEITLVEAFDNAIVRTIRRGLPVAEAVEILKTLCTDAIKEIRRRRH